MKMNWRSTGAIAASVLMAGVIAAWAAQTNYLGTVFVADPTTPTRQLTVNSDGSINATVVSGGGITQLTGDVTAGPGSGSVAATLVTAQSGAHTWSAAQTISSAALAFSGNISAAAWTTNGLRIKAAAASYTDTSSSGTVAAAYTDVFGASTVLASSATTYTQYYGAFFKAPVASTNVTMTNKSALGADTMSIGGAAQGTLALAVTGTAAISGVVGIGGAIIGGTTLGVTGPIYTTTNLVMNAGTTMTSNGDGGVRITNAAVTGFTILNLGPATTSFPALKRSTTTVQIRLGDDSGYAGFDAGTYSTAGVAGVDCTGITAGTVTVAKGIVTHC